MRGKMRVLKGCEGVLRSVQERRSWTASVGAGDDARARVGVAAGEGVKDDSCLAPHQALGGQAPSAVYRPQKLKPWKQAA